MFVLNNYVAYSKVTKTIWKDAIQDYMSDVRKGPHNLLYVKIFMANKNLNTN